MHENGGICSVHGGIPAPHQEPTAQGNRCYGKLRPCIRQCGRHMCAGVQGDVCGECQRQEKQCYGVLVGIIRAFGPATVEGVYQDALDKVCAEVYADEPTN